MRTFIKSLSFILMFFISANAFAAKVYSPTGSVTAKTYKERGYVSRIQDPLFNEIVTLGMVSDVSVLNIFGENPAVSDATEDIWDGGGHYNYSVDETADILSIASDATEDALSIFIKGLDASGDIVEQTIAISTTLGVRTALTTPLWRVLEADNDGTSDLVGNVFIYTGTSTAPSLGGTTVRAVILAGNNKMHTSLYTIPDDKVGMIIQHETGINKGDASTDVESILFTREYGKVFKIQKRVGFLAGENGVYQDKKLIIVPGKSDIKFRSNDSLADAVGMFGSYELMIFDESFLETDFLSDIGQPGY